MKEIKIAVIAFAVVFALAIIAANLGSRITIEDCECKKESEDKSDKKE